MRDPLGWATLISFIFLTTGVVMQVIKVLRRKTTQDIALWEVALRAIGTFVISVRWITTANDWFGGAGQVLIFLATLINLLVIGYSRAVWEKNTKNKGVPK